MDRCVEVPPSSGNRNQATLIPPENSLQLPLCGQGTLAHTCMRAQAVTTKGTDGGLRPRTGYVLCAWVTRVLHLPSSHLKGLSPTVPAAEVFLCPHQHVAMQKRGQCGGTSRLFCAPLDNWDPERDDLQGPVQPDPSLPQGHYLESADKLRGQPAASSPGLPGMATSWATSVNGSAGRTALRWGF